MRDLSQRLSAALADRYRVERELGRGGMATVYLAEDLKHRTRRAIKVLDPEVASAIGPERFLHEIETTASLTHPHILPLHDSGQADGLLYYVMPYVEGESLRERLRREKQLPLDEALRITREVADALSYAHSQGVVHRDIKPENILLEQGHAVVADFGIARAVASTGPVQLTSTGVTLAVPRTSTGVVLGTVAYMSPEQVTGSRDLDGRSDLYSLACVLYEMLAGQPPFTGPTAQSLAYQHQSASPRPVTELRPAVPAGVAAAVQRALAKVPADRFSSVVQFGEALENHESAGAAGAAQEAPPVTVPPKPRPVMRLVAGTAVVVAYLAIAAFQHWWPFSGPPPLPGHKDWILVAEFDGPADDTTLASAARSLVSAALDQSEILATVPQEQIELALEQAGKPAGTRVTGLVARELAYRRSVRAVLEGEIGRIGTGYSIVLRVVDAESLEMVVTERGSAKDEDELIPALGKMAEKLRRDLGERRDAIAATRPLQEFATPSFEAYRAYVKADRASDLGDWDSAIALSKEALRLDPGFAMAWKSFALMQWNMGRRDSFLVALDQALRHPERMTAAQRQRAEAYRDAQTGSVEQGLAAYLKYERLYPGNPVVLNTISMRLSMLGRLEEALEYNRKAQRQNPFGPSVAALNNEIGCLLNLGRIDEARELARNLKALPGSHLRAAVELAACNWAAAESLALVAAEDPGVGTLNRGLALGHLAKARAGQGQLRAAAATLTRGALFWAAASSPRSQVVFGGLLLFLAVQTEGAIALPPASWASDSSVISLVYRGLRAAATGDVDSPRRLLEEIQWRPTSEVGGETRQQALLEARVAALSGNWEEVVHILRPIAAQTRWATFLLADAFEKLGAPDSAATYLQRMTTDPAAWVDCSGITRPLAHRRLILLDASLGRLEEADRHLAVLERWWDRPDDVAQGMLDEARNAVSSARGVAGHERAGT